MRVRSQTAVLLASGILVAALGACTPPAGSGDPTTTTTTTTSTTTTTTTPPPVHQVDQENSPATPTSVSFTTANCASQFAPLTIQSAQTFTAGATGQLDQVDLVVSIRHSNAAPLSVSIQSVTPAGGPSGIELGSGTYAGPATDPSIAEIPLSSPAAVVAGTQYALVLSESSCADPSINWPWEFRGGSTEYASGAFWSSASAGAPNWIDYFATYALDYDLRFRTWVA